MSINVGCGSEFRQSLDNLKRINFPILIQSEYQDLRSSLIPHRGRGASLLWSSPCGGLTSIKSIIAAVYESCTR